MADIQDNSGEGWMSTRQAAKYLGFALQTLYNRVATDPTFPARRPGGGRSLRFRKSELDAWVRGQVVETPVAVAS